MPNLGHMKAYKLVRVMANGELASLFINKTDRLQMNTWLTAEEHRTKGFAYRPFWHCTARPEAPHMTMEGRAWYRVELRDYDIMERPSNQGGVWILAREMKILHEHR